MAESLRHAVCLCSQANPSGSSANPCSGPRQQGQHAKDAATDVPDAVVGAGVVLEEAEDDDEVPVTVDEEDDDVEVDA